MNQDFEIEGGRILVQGPHELDLHNAFKFSGLEYSVARRNLLLSWHEFSNEHSGSNGPKSVCVEFNEVSEFQFIPGHSGIPITEDDCVSHIGYWVNEEWCEGVILVESHQAVEPHWHSAIEFMSGAMLTVLADSGCAKITA